MRKDDSKRIQSKNEIHLDSQSKLNVARINLTIGVILFLIFDISLMLLFDPERNGIGFGNTRFNSTVVSGILAQFQALLSVIMVLIPLRSSYTIVLGLNVVHTISIFRAIMLVGDTSAVPGLLVSLSTFIIVTIINKYGRNLKKQIEKVVHQKEQLMHYNHIMEDNEKLLYHIAYYDSLTELPNRKMMIDKLDSLTNDVSATSDEFIYVFFDLDDFKTINDTMGHSVGDVVLSIIVKRWKTLVQEGDMLARFGGDEFALLICRKLTDEELINYVTSYKEVLSEAIQIKQKDFHINISCGITKYPIDGNNTTELLQKADIALYTMKNKGKNGLLFYTKEMQEEVIQRAKLEHGLLSAIENDELSVVFQPMYYCDSQTLRGFEVLTRWNSKELGTVAPDLFIPIAEKNESIIEIGEWIMKTSLIKAKTLQEIYPIDLIISINISVVQIMDPNFINRIKRVLEEIDFDSKYLEFEITESVFILCQEHFIEVINELRALGILIAMDDFGTGYASLSNLQMLPIDTLKIDKSFIDKITLGNENKPFVGTIIELAHQLELKVVAEGVEEELQLSYLTEKKCDYIQGYLFSKPLTEDKVKELLAEERIG